MPSQADKLFATVSPDVESEAAAPKRKSAADIAFERQSRDAALAAANPTSLTEEWDPARPGTGMGRTALTQLGLGASKNWADELAGAAGRPDIEAQIRRENMAQQQAHPIAAPLFRTVGDVASDIGVGALASRIPVVGPPIAAAMASPLGQAVIGGISGMGGAEGTFEQRIPAGLEGFVASGTASTLGQMAAPIIKGVAGAGARGLQYLANTNAAKALGLGATEAGAETAGTLLKQGGVIKPLQTPKGAIPALQELATQVPKDIRALLDEAGGVDFGRGTTTDMFNWSAVRDQIPNLNKTNPGRLMRPSSSAELDYAKKAIKNFELQPRPLSTIYDLGDEFIKSTDPTVQRLGVAIQSQLGVQMEQLAGKETAAQFAHLQDVRHAIPEALAAIPSANVGGGLGAMDIAAGALGGGAAMAGSPKMALAAMGTEAANRLFQPYKASTTAYLQNAGAQAVPNLVDLLESPIMSKSAQATIRSLLSKPDTETVKRYEAKRKQREEEQ